MTPIKYSCVVTLLLISTLLQATEKTNTITHSNQNLKAVIPKDEPTEITVIIEKNRKIEEYRHKGELVLVKVTPKDGKPYFLDPLENKNLGSGKELIEAGVKPVHWIVKEF